MKILLCSILFGAALCSQTQVASAAKPSVGTSADIAGTSARATTAAGVESGGLAHTSRLLVAINKSVVVQNATPIRRISVANSDIAEALAVSSSEILLNGKAPGDTSLVVWDHKGGRTAYDVHVEADDTSVDAIRGELQKEVGPDVSITVEGKNVFLRGTVQDPIAVDRAAAIASTLGKVVNLLRVVVPPAEPQILLKVRFADIDRLASSQLGANLFGIDSAKGLGSTTTGQFGTAPNFNLMPPPTASISDLLNIFFYRPDLNLGAVVQDLQAKQVLQILAEPNLLTISGRPASFLAGGQFPFPTIQGGANGVGQITIQFKEFGIRLNFLPTITPRGTIRLAVTPEVSSLDYSNGLTVSGYTIPGLATKRVQTEIELENGQSFAIAGLLDNQTTEAINKLPGLANIPVLGNFFKSRSVTKNNSELLVMVTPELVKPIPAGTKAPDVHFDKPFMKGTSTTAPQNPTGSSAPLVKVDSLPYEILRNEQATPAPASPMPDTGTIPNAAASQPAQSASAGSQPPK